MAADFDTIVNLAKRRGFVFQSSEIYGGLRSAYDYGPLGVELLRNVKDQWWHSTVRMRDDVVGIDSAILQSPEVWDASGHVNSFSDPLVECRECNSRHRLDKLDDPEHVPDLRQLGHLHGAQGVQPHVQDPHGSDRVRGQRVYLRPETAQGIFINYENVRRTAA